MSPHNLGRTQDRPSRAIGKIRGCLRTVTPAPPAGVRLYGARMSQPVDPNRGYPGRPQQQPYGGQPYQGDPYGQQPYGGQQQYGGQPYGGQQQYGAQPYRDPRYDAQPPGQQQYGGQRSYAPPTRRAPMERPARGLRLPRRIPGLGLLLTVLGLVVQVLSFTVLPWVRFGAADSGSVAIPRIWQLAAENGTHGFGGWYVVLFSYPLAVLGIVLALASVLESVASKVIWGGLALVGLGVLALKYGFGSLGGGGLDLSALQIVIAIAAVAGLVVVVFMLRTAVAMFRRVAGLILLGLAGVHVAAITDLVRDSGVEQLSVGAFGPALGYLLTAVAAFAGPRRLAGLS